MRRVLRRARDGVALDAAEAELLLHARGPGPGDAVHGGGAGPRRRSASTPVGLRHTNTDTHVPLLELRGRRPRTGRMARR